jgi:hypothetical protein
VKKFPQKVFLLKLKLKILKKKNKIQNTNVDVVHSVSKVILNFYFSLQDLEQFIADNQHKRLIIEENRNKILSDSSRGVCNYMVDNFGEHPTMDEKVAVCHAFIGLFLFPSLKSENGEVIVGKLILLSNL